MDILITGNVVAISNGFYEQLGTNYKIAVCGKGTQQEYSAKNVTPYNYNIGEDEFESIFKTFHFKSVIYISKALDGTKKVFDELESLENTLYLCKQHKVSDFIYIAPNEYQQGTHENSKNSRYILLQACEKLCSNFWQENEMNLTILRVPYVYNTEKFDTQLGNWINSGIVDKKIVFPGIEADEVDFLWDEDLGNLISRMLDEPYRGFLEMNVSGQNKLSFQVLGELISDELEDIKLIYKNGKLAIPQYANEARARELFGWIPVGNIEEQIKELIHKDKEALKKKNKLQFMGGRNSKIKTFLVTAVELTVLFAIAVLLDYWVGDNSQLGFFDFRLIFVIIVGTMRGLNKGIIAALMACVGYVASASMKMDWQIIFYNVQNWLPFATYFLVGAILGYTSDKKQDEIRFLKEEQDVIENKYVLLSELYMKALENVDEYNSQIIGYKDSYGRIYSVIRKLSSTLPDRIFYEAVNVLEDILDNRYVAIYSVDKNGVFARLNVCSKSLGEVLEKSIRIEDYPEIMTALQEGELWINTEGHLKYPAYAMSILRDGKMVGLVFLMQAGSKQMNREFSNKFSIVTGLIKESLIRAIEWMELVEKDSMIPGTRILKKDEFKQILDVKNQMREKEFSEFLLLKILNTNMSLAELSNTVSRQVRSNDVIGQGEDEQIYLLLSQTNIKYISTVAERLEKSGIQYEVINL